MEKVLVVIDYQNDFVNGSLGFKIAEELENGIYQKVISYLKDGHKVIFTYDTHSENYLETREGKNLPILHCRMNTEGHRLYGKVNEFVNDENTIHLNKYSFGISPQEIIRLSEKLGDNIEQIEFVGVVTNICVISNIVMFQSKYINSEIIVDASLCASFDKKLHEKALDVMEGLQVKVINRK